MATVIDALGAGESYEGVERDYQVTREQILTALRYAAHVAAHQPPGRRTGDALAKGVKRARVA